jgi:hypothetical protein
MAREATTSMVTDSDGGIDEYVNTVMTIAESSGHGTVDAVVPSTTRQRRQATTAVALRCMVRGRRTCVSHSRLVHGIERRSGVWGTAAHDSGGGCGREP